MDHLGDLARCSVFRNQSLKSNDQKCTKGGEKRRLVSSFDDSESVVKVPYEKVSNKKYWKRWRLFNFKKRQKFAEKRGLYQDRQRGERRKKGAEEARPKVIPSEKVTDFKAWSKNSRNITQRLNDEIRYWKNGTTKKPKHKKHLLGKESFCFSKGAG